MPCVPSRQDGGPGSLRETGESSVRCETSTNPKRSPWGLTSGLVQASLLSKSYVKVSSVCSLTLCYNATHTLHGKATCGRAQRCEWAAGFWPGSERGGVIIFARICILIVLSCLQRGTAIWERFTQMLPSGLGQQWTRFQLLWFSKHTDKLWRGLKTSLTIDFLKNHFCQRTQIRFHENYKENLGIWMPKGFLKNYRLTASWAHL